MSIYCSFGGFDDRSCVDYDKPVSELKDAEAILSDDRMFRLKDEPCAWDSECPDCHGIEAPFVYQRSHVMPQLDHERGGDLHLAYVASHIPTPRERSLGKDYADEREDGTPRHPWLRVGVNQEIIVLHRVQVAMLVDQLNGWLSSDFLDDDEYAPLPGSKKGEVK